LIAQQEQLKSQSDSTKQLQEQLAEALKQKMAAIEAAQKASEIEA